DRRVDPDDLALEIHQGTSGIARVDRRVGLDEVLVRGNAYVGASGGADDSDGHGLVQSEWIADGDGPLTDLERVGISERGDSQGMLIGLETHEREVCLRISAKDLPPVLALVGKTDDDFIRPFDDVKVGQDQAALVDDDAGPESWLAILRARRHGPF